MRQDIFPYYDGERNRWADPFAVDRILSSYLDGDPTGYREKSLSPIAEISNPAVERMKQAICAAFKLPPFNETDGTGTREDALWEVFDNFVTWRQKKKLTSASLPTSEQPSGLGQSSPVVDWGAIGKQLMDCGCS